MKSETGKKKTTVKDDISESPNVNDFTKQQTFKFTKGATRQFDGLSVNRVPDIEPAIPPSSYLYYRYMHPRGQSSAMFSKAQELLLQQKQRTIADFELKLKKQQDRIKKVKQ